MMHLLLRWALLILAAAPAFGQWTAPVPFGVAHGNAIRGPWISNDNLRMYAAFSGYIFVSERVHPDSAWHPFHTVNNHINGANRQESPCESPSGDTLYFMAEGREPTYGWYDIYYTVKTDSGWWGPILNCGPNINTSSKEWTVGISRDGSKLLVSAGDFAMNLYSSDRQSDSQWGPRVNCGPNVNTTYGSEEHGSFSPDNQRLVFYRLDTRNGDILISNWQDSTWGPAAYIPEPATTAAWEESDPCWSRDGRSIYFVSDRGHRYDRQLYVITDTTVSTALLPHGAALPQQIEPALFGYVQGNALRLTLVIQGRAQSGRLRLYDVLGRLVKDIPLALHATDGALTGLAPLDAMPSGSYWADLQYRQAHFSTRFTVTR